MPEFGVIICTCKFDFFMAKACVASARFSLGDVPITLFIDDQVDVRAFAKHYGVQVMYRSEVHDPWLRAVNTGWGFPKMTMLWESPYEKFLYLDCDTIVWGDVVKAHLQPFDADFIIDPGDVISRPWSPDIGSNTRIEMEYFHPGLMEKVYPDFPWEKYRHNYFCTGVWAARRNSIPLATYRKVYETRNANPGLFTLSEMPLLNFLIFDGEEKGELKVRRAPIQTVCEWDNQEFLKSTFVTDSTGPKIAQPAPTVLHFTDPKPLASSRGFNEPMQYFREQSAREFLGIPSFLAELYTRLEEIEWRLRVTYRRKLGGMHVRLRNAIRSCLNRDAR